MEKQQRQQLNNNSESGFKLVGFTNFKPAINPKSDRFRVKNFHHIEFWCTDATNSAHRFSWGLGMPIVSKSDLSTGNMVHASYLLRSGELNFLFTAPYSPSIAGNDLIHTASIPTFDHSLVRSFTSSHGLAVRAIAIEVEDAEQAFNISVSHGAKPSSTAIKLDEDTLLSEICLYGDVV
ncbi:4-hydroxyphenylpyruvate dioxygenase [Thalictrum thalictroides]|uniref:4-hydroxyphenylpyruvate dioxygenase n=1 Tax=Thalictrum thalictroides TaxID=46969 RepID=A0A7J6XCB8_THATH|nr:4-hydroxyphenylpyruvate dioxygenase [Thalictrum thalictroides]